MNAQEREQLSHFLKQMAETRLPQKDQEADTLIREAAARQPDALYLLAQRALLLEQALTVSKNQIAELQTQLARPGGNSSFLPSDPWAQPQPTQPPRYQAPPAPQAAAPWGGGASSFLGNVASTAAGVVAGSFLFQGIESLMGHHNTPWGGNEGLGGGLHDQADNVTINNYYGDDAAPNHDLNNQPNDAFDNDVQGGDDFAGGDDSGWI